jgi:4-hydroxy-tetrahydrodipicolinate synthase
MDAGGTGGIHVSSHLVGTEMRRIIDEPDNRHEIWAGLEDLFKALFAAPSPIAVKAALEMAGHRVGIPRLPMVEASEEEKALIREALERHGLLAKV